MTEPNDNRPLPPPDASPPPRAESPEGAQAPQDSPPPGPSTHNWRPDGPPSHPSGQPMNQPPPPMQPPAYGQPYGGDPYGGGTPPYGGQPGQYGAPPPPPGQPPGPYGGYPQYGPPAQYSAHGITAPDDTTWATLGYVGQVVIGVIAPLIVYLSRKDRSPFVRYHGAQALNLGLTALIVSFGGMALAFVIGIVTMGIGLIILLPAIIAFSIAQLVYMIIAAIRANRQEMYQIPTWVCWPMVK